MPRLVGFAGSLRAGSYNRALIAAAAAAMPAGSVLDVLSVDAVPLFNADVEAAGFPPVVAELKDRVAAADGLVIATPEYNGGIPGIAKNVIDWLSRPPDDARRVLGGKPVALLGATTGGLGTAFSQAAWEHVLRTLRMKLWVGGGPFYVSGAPQHFDADSKPDAELAQRLETYMAQFIGSIA